MNKDKFGIFLSITCLIHCIGFPLILPMLPLLGFVAEHEWFWHLCFSIPIILMALIAFISGYKLHRLLEIPIIGFLGSILIILPTFFEMYNQNDIGFAIIGSILLIIAHYINHQASCKCKHHKHAVNEKKIHS